VIIKRLNLQTAGEGLTSTIRIYHTLVSSQFFFLDMFTNLDVIMLCRIDLKLTASALPLPCGNCVIVMSFSADFHVVSLDWFCLAMQVFMLRVISIKFSCI